MSDWCQSTVQMDWAQGPAIAGETVLLKYIRAGDIFERQDMGQKQTRDHLWHMNFQWYRMAPWESGVIGYWNGKTGRWEGYYNFPVEKSKELFKIIKLSCDDPIVVLAETENHLSEGG